MLDNSYSFPFVIAGEIVIAGVEGNGQRELVEMLFSLNTPDSGTITVTVQTSRQSAARQDSR